MRCSNIVARFMSRFFAEILSSWSGFWEQLAGPSQSLCSSHSRDVVLLVNMASAPFKFRADGNFRQFQELQRYFHEVYHMSASPSVHPRALSQNRLSDFNQMRHSCNLVIYLCRLTMRRIICESWHWHTVKHIKYLKDPHFQKGWKGRRIEKRSYSNFPIIFTTSRPALDAIRILNQRLKRVFSKRISRPERESNRSLQTNAELKNPCIYTSTPSYFLLA
jgi:hypothetical protein